MVYFVCFCLIRFALPACLTVSFLFRQNLLSLIYLLLFLYLPMVKVPTTKTMAGGTGVYLKLVMAISVLTSISQLSFQIVLLSMPEYGHFLPYCEFLEKLLRHIGLVRLDNISPLNCVINLGPEVMMLIGSVTIYLLTVRFSRVSPRSLSRQSSTVSEHAQTQNSNKKKFRFLIAIGKYLCLALLCLAGVMRPSITSALYFVTFLGGMTWWASYHSLGRPFAVTLRCICAVAALHILALFSIQTQWVQEWVGEDCSYCRYFGLTPLMITSCTDPRDFKYHENVEWASYVNPIVLLCLYYLLMLESRLLMRPGVAFNAVDMPDFLSETTPLMQSISPSRKYSQSPPRSDGTVRNATVHMYQDPLGSVTIHDETDELIQLKAVEEKAPSKAKEKEDAANQRTMLDHLFSATISIVQLINKSSYIATNIIMMAWSITYHSWITFVLLLWASMLWMMPNQRRAMLRCSPFLVCYAMLLLIVQYIYSMDLTEDELPEQVQGFNLKQIGLEKPVELPIKTLMAKCMYTIMFWLTLRQYMQEKVEARRSSALEDMVAPLAVTVGTATRGFSEQMETIPSPFMSRIGKFVKGFLTKFWIWVVAIMLFVIGIGGTRMTVLRVVYMALFLIFILTFQLSYEAWRKMLFGFWITVIIYSMTILVTVYTYQFDHFDEYWDVTLGIPLKLQLDIGLEKFQTGELFVRLLTPTFFLIITVIQLHYFHKDFLEISNISRRRLSSRTRESSVLRSEGSSAAATREMEEMEKEVVENQIESDEPPHLPSFRQLRSISMHEVKALCLYVYKRLMQLVDFCWLFLELHILKIVLLSIMLMCIYDVCALHFVFLLLSVVALMFNSRVHVIISHVCAVLISILLLAKMVYQIEYIDHNLYAANCTNISSIYNDSTPVAEKVAFDYNTMFDKATRQTIMVNNVDWLGFHKTSATKDLAGLLKGYIGIILVATVMALVNVRQTYKRQLQGRYTGRPHSMFPHVKRDDADKDLITCIKYFFNYGFYRFGVEICLMATVALIGTRMDVFSVFYAMWLCYLYALKREKLASVWIFYQMFIVVMTPLQYAMAVGFPPGLCIDYPWYKAEILRRVQDWMYLPDREHPPAAYKLACDFILLLLTCRQSLVFRIEKRHEGQHYPGGTNKDITAEADMEGFVNPVPDHISYIRSWLDIFKRGILSSFMWITLAIVFLAGTNRVNFFSLGYLVGSFIFLWQGEDIYLRPIKMILYWWNMLLGFNVFVICFKTLLQIPGCIFITQMLENACWVVQLLGIACIKRFPTTVASAGISDPAAECTVNRDDVGVVWDGICFGFLIVMRRLFSSYYFMHQIDETKAMTILASRGAELIEELREKQIVEQQDEERTILEKIKLKMERIKATQQKIQGPMFKEPSSHYVAGEEVQIRRRRPRHNREAIRSGDYYMFDEFDDTEVEDKENIDDNDNDSDNQRNDRNVTLGKLFSTALKKDIKQAADLVLRNEVPSSPDTQQQSPSLSHPDLRTSQPADRDEDAAESLAPPSGPGSRRHSKERSDFSGSDVDDIELQRLADEEDEETKRSSFWQKIWHWIKFAWAFVESAMISMTRGLNKYSRDYRYVVKVLAMEKKMLKEKAGFGAGMRTGASKVWQPLPESLLDRSRLSLYNPSLDELDNIHELSAQDQIPVVRLLLALWYAIISHSDLVCYFIVFLNQIKSATILSLPLPLMVLLWGTLTVPRPTKTFWVTIIAYTEAIVIIKCMFQFELLPWNQTAVLANMPFYPPRIIGIEKMPNYAVYDLTLLLIVFFHRFMLKSLGLWKSTDDTVSFNPGFDQRVEVEPDMALGLLKVKAGTAPPLKRGLKDKLGGKAKDHEIKRLDLQSKGNKHITNDGTNIEHVMSDEDLKASGLRRRSSEIRMVESHLKGYLPNQHSALIQTVSATGSQGSAQSSDGRNIKKLKFDDPGFAPEGDSEGSHHDSATSINRHYIYVHTDNEEMKDHLPGVIMLILGKYTGSLKNFFSDLMSPYARVTADVYAIMFLCDFINFMVVIFGFAAFGTQQGDGGVSAYLEENKVPIPFLVMLILQFALIIIDRALFLRKYILGKIVFQYILIIGVHIWMFFILPAVTERQFNAKSPPQIWYMMKCFYLLLSAYQIRCGYPTRILGNFLCKHYNIINMVLFKCFMAIPFLFELRALMDWIWTDTSMTLMDWLKMEDIFAHIFQLKCARRMEAEYPAPRGEKKAPYLKYLVGGGALFLIIAIIWFPLVLFAFGNTVGQPNLPYDVTVTLRIGPYEPIYKMSAQQANIKKFTENQWQIMGANYKKDRTAQTFLSNYDHSDAAAIHLSGDSTNTWGISPPDRKRLKADVEGNVAITIKLTWAVSRVSNNKEVSGLVTESQEYDLEKETDESKSLHSNRKRLLNMLALNDTEPILIKEIFPKFIKVTNRGKATAVKQLMGTISPFRTLQLHLRHKGTCSNCSVQWWDVTTLDDDDIFRTLLNKMPYFDTNPKNSLVMYIFNDKAFPEGLNFISGGGIISLYTTLVLLASSMIRGYFTGISFTIMFDDMPNVDRIMQLCLDIYLVRESGELDLEEDLFAKLVFLYRSPETLIKWTRPREEEEAEGDEGGQQPPAAVVN